jgi:cytochrome P450
MRQTTISYNPFQPGFAEEPYPHYAEVREADPVHRTVFDVWMLFRYEEVLRMLRDPGLSVEDRKARPTPAMQMAREMLGDRHRCGPATRMVRHARAKPRAHPRPSTARAYR